MRKSLGGQHEHSALTGISRELLLLAKSVRLVAVVLCSSACAPGGAQVTPESACQPAAPESVEPRWTTSGIYSPLLTRRVSLLERRSNSNGLRHMMYDWLPYQPFAQLPWQQSIRWRVRPGERDESGFTALAKHTR